MPVCLPVVPCRGIRAQEAGLAHVDFREGDAQAPAFPDVSVHVVVSSSVIFFLPDPLEALRNWRRVLKPGGRVLFSTFGPDNNVPLAGIFNRHLATYGLQRPSPVSSSYSEAGEPFTRGRGRQQYGACTGNMARI
jgi:ubiquinone/menaquinone biosynthesis C-methylase UbiE